MAKNSSGLLDSVKEALAFARGEADHGCVVHIPDEINVKRIRRNLGMSQKVFADYFGVSVRTLQDWEQGRRVPIGVARNFLMVIDKEPEVVHRVLNG